MTILSIFARRKEEDYPNHYLENLHAAIGTAFEYVKKDTSHLFSWVNYFHQKHQEHDQKFNSINQKHQEHENKFEQLQRQNKEQQERLAKVEQQIQLMPKSHQEIKQVIDYYYSYEHIIQRINEISSRLSELERKKLEKNITGREKLVQKIAKNSKDYVKAVIVSLINKYSRISGAQLKEIVVNEQGLCSKSSFYRLLEEIEQEGSAELIQSGKEKEYLSKTPVIK
jgi:Na+/phosphate symporter